MYEFTAISKKKPAFYRVTLHIYVQSILETVMDILVPVGFIAFIVPTSSLLVGHIP